VIFVFPGQGSQYVGMGKSFYDQFSCAKNVFKEVDDALGQDLSKIIFSGTDAQLSSTQNTQPALMATSLAALDVLLNESGKKIQDIAKYLAGHSLGEYSAICASGALDVADTAKLLKIRGQAMQSAVPEGLGAMVALLKIGYAEVKKMLDQFPDCQISNDNSTEQVVVSGKAEKIRQFCEHAKKSGVKRIVKLNVSAPFHCKLMLPAAQKMQEALEDIKFLEPKVPFVCNVTAEVISDTKKIKPLLVDQVTKCVRWRQTIEYCKANKISKFIEIGAGNVLAKLIKTNIQRGKNMQSCNSR
jgi:[acyl-carrier-protein] S-malonyltransferase